MSDRIDDRPATERGEIRERTASDDAGFLPEQRMGDLRERWNDVQASFVDDPRKAVSQAETLVEDLVRELTSTFTREREQLENRSGGEKEADTEALRIALQRYRSFFNRLLGTTSA